MLLCLSGLVIKCFFLFQDLLWNFYFSYMTPLRGYQEFQFSIPTFWKFSAYNFLCILFFYVIILFIYLFVYLVCSINLSLFFYDLLSCHLTSYQKTSRLVINVLCSLFHDHSSRMLWVLSLWIASTLSGHLVLRKNKTATETGNYKYQMSRNQLSLLFTGTVFGLFFLDFF